MNDLILSEEELWKGSLFSVRRQRIRSPKGKHYFRELVHRSDGVAVVPVLPDGRVLMIEEYAAGARQSLLFIPGGMTAATTESERQREAQRELREETGHRANRLMKLWEVYEAPSIILDRKLHIYLGLDLAADPLESPDDDEEISPVPMTLDEAIARCSKPAATSGSMLGALFLAKQYLARLH